MFILKNPAQRINDLGGFSGIFRVERANLDRRYVNKSKWCRRRESNPHSHWPPDFESGTSTSSITPALEREVLF